MKTEFLAWDKKDKRMFNPRKMYQTPGAGIWICSESIVWDNRRGCTVHDVEHSTINHQDARYVLRQFLGRTDRHGKKLFEGDIIKHWEYGRDDDVTDGVPEILLIESLEGFFKHVGYTGRELGEEWASKDIEIIGNKFQNPKLIPKEKGMWLE